MEKKRHRNWIHVVRGQSKPRYSESESEKSDQSCESEVRQPEPKRVIQHTKTQTDSEFQRLQLCYQQHLRSIVWKNVSRVQSQSWRRNKRSRKGETKTIRR